MKSLIAATAAVVVGLAAANMLGVAAAEAPTTASPERTVSVQGVATVPIAQGANATTANAVYREAMAAAVADGQSKAEFLAGKAAATLGSVQNIVEDGGYIQCTTGEESGAEYQGEQPDFGSGPAISPSGVSVPAAAPTVRKPAVKHRKSHGAPVPLAKPAAATSCTLGTQVSLLYTIN